jgi:hypothetical protein
MEQLQKLCIRDNARLLGEYNKIVVGTVINFICNCNVTSTNTIRNIRVTGFFCEKCLSNKKGFYKKNPDNYDKCSVCNLIPQTDESIVDDNWETCWGRNMFFCPNHRVQYPCNNELCEADPCYNFRENKNWKNMIKYWDYDNEKYN